MGATQFMTINTTLMQSAWSIGVMHILAKDGCNLPGVSVLCMFWKDAQTVEAFTVAPAPSNQQSCFT
jgi:hypothetical protein